jgi:hypothetical protein
MPLLWEFRFRFNWLAQATSCVTDLWSPLDLLSRGQIEIAEII